MDINTIPTPPLTQPEEKKNSLNILLILGAFLTIILLVVTVILYKMNNAIDNKSAPQVSIEQSNLQSSPSPIPNNSIDQELKNTDEVLNEIDKNAEKVDEGLSEQAVDLNQ